VLDSKGAAIEGSVEGFFALQTAKSFHTKIHQDLGKSETIALAAVDLGGQTNQFAWEKGTAATCTFPLKPPQTTATHVRNAALGSVGGVAPADPNKAEFGTSTAEYPLDGKQYCSQSSMWGLNGFGNGQADFNTHQRGMMNAINSSNSATPTNTYPATQLL